MKEHCVDEPPTHVEKIPLWKPPTYYLLIKWKSLLSLTGNAKALFGVAFTTTVKRKHCTRGTYAHIGGIIYGSDSTSEPLVSNCKVSHNARAAKRIKGQSFFFFFSTLSSVSEPFCLNTGIEREHLTGTIEEPF